MNYENLAKLASEATERLSTEMQNIMRKPNWGGPDVKLVSDLLCDMKEAMCVAKMAQEETQGGGGYSGDYSGRRGYSHAMGGRSNADGFSTMGGNSGNNYSGEGSYAGAGNGYAGGGYSQHSIDDRVIAMLEEMAGRAGSDYERSRIKEKIDTLRRM